MTQDRSQVIRLVADPFVVRDRDETVLSDELGPLLVWAVVGEEIGVSLDGRSSGGEFVGKAIAKITVGEEDEPQAARSYSTASSISESSRL